MAQVLTVKIQLITHAFDDIIGVFEDIKKFVEGTEDRCNIYQVKGYTGEEFRQYLYSIRFQRAEATRSKTIEWTIVHPEEKHVWKDTDGKWYFLEKTGLEWSLKNWTSGDKDKMASGLTAQLDRVQIMEKIINNYAEYQENFVEVPNIQDK